MCKLYCVELSFYIAEFAFDIVEFDVTESVIPFAVDKSDTIEEADFVPNKT